MMRLSSHRRLQLLAISIAMAATFGCNDDGSPAQGAKDGQDPCTVKHAREIMGTFANVTAVAPNETEARAAVDAGYAGLEHVNALMSDYIDDSEIGRLNALPAGEAMTVSPETLSVLQRARAISQASDGAFDVTCRPLVELWKHAGETNNLPDEKRLERVRERVGWGKLLLDEENRTVTKQVESMQIDLGGIAKGYGLDLAADAMKKAGATGGIVDVGGDVVVFGTQSDGTPWRIGVRNPFEDGLILKLALVDRAVATSGHQQRFSTIQGKRYPHILDPRTGRPAEQASAVTVIAPDGMTADAWATVFSVLSVDEGQQLLAELDEIDVAWFEENGPAGPQMVIGADFARYMVSD